MERVRGKVATSFSEARGSFQKYLVFILREKDLIHLEKMSFGQGCVSARPPTVVFAEEEGQGAGRELKRSIADCA